MTETSERVEEERVEERFACPDCGESREDYLVWDKDGEFVTCGTCGTVYDPAEVIQEG